MIQTKKNFIVSIHAVVYGRFDRTCILMYVWSFLAILFCKMRRLMGKPTMWFSWENQQCGFRTGLTQTGLYSHRRWLETGNFEFSK